MDEKEKDARLKIIGEAIRLSDLSDEDLVKWVIIDMLKGINEAKLIVDAVGLAEMISLALCGLGGFHRHKACAW